MMDERQLSELFQTAAHDVPPPSFDAADIAAQSRRITDRRRAMVVGGSSLAVVLLAVGLFVGLGGFPRTPSSSTAASAGTADSGPGQGKQNAAPNAAPRFPAATPLQGGVSAGRVGPPVADTAPDTGCGPADRALAVALASEFPAAGATGLHATTLMCPNGARWAGYLVHDGANTGDLIVVVTPGDEAPSLPADGASRASAAAGGHRVVVVLSVPAPSSPGTPFADRLTGIASDIAGKV
jgi:hypothetical protein